MIFFLTFSVNVNYIIFQINCIFAEAETPENLKRVQKLNIKFMIMQIKWKNLRKKSNFKKRKHTEYIRTK